MVEIWVVLLSANTDDGAQEPENGEICDKPRAEECGRGSVGDWLQGWNREVQGLGKNWG